MEEYVPNIKPEIKDLPQMFLNDLCQPRRIDEKTIFRISEVTDDHLIVIDRYILTLRKL